MLCGGTDIAGRGGWFAELPLPLPPYYRYPGMDAGGGRGHSYITFDPSLVVS